MRDFNECRTGSGAAKDACGIGKRLRNFIRAGDAAGKACKRPENVNLLRSFMQAAALLCLQDGSYVGADQQNRRVGLQAFQQRHQGEEIPRAGGGEDGGNAAARPIEAVRGKARGLFMPDYPVVKLPSLPQSFINGNVVNAGNAETAVDPGVKEPFHNGLRAELGRGRRRLR